MESTDEDFISSFHDGFALNYYTIALTALYLYDYLLTFADEVRYAWRGKKTWVFFLFLAIRYIPMVYRFWSIVQWTLPGYTQEVCDWTAFIHILAFILGTWMAQVALALRVYAITSKNIYIAACLALLSAGQLGLGIYQIVLVMITPAIPSQEIPQLRILWCVTSRHRAVEIASTVLALPFDIITFAATIHYAAKQGVVWWSGTGNPIILRTLVRDGTLYFTVIFTAHIIHTFMLILGRPFIQLIPAIGINVYVSIMICRLMLSVRKAAATCEGWESYTCSSLFTSSGDDPRNSIQFVSDVVLSIETETTNLEPDHLPHLSR